LHVFVLLVAGGDIGRLLVLAVNVIWKPVLGPFKEVFRLMF